MGENKTSEVIYLDYSIFKFLMTNPIFNKIAHLEQILNNTCFTNWYYQVQNDRTPSIKIALCIWIEVS